MIYNDRSHLKKALLIHPEFSPVGFWNYKEVCRLTGAKYPAAPLGLITLAALFTEDWDIRLIDMNTGNLDNSDILWADLVFIGGMLSQQTVILKLIDRVHALGKKVVVGGPDPTSQPEVYHKADYRVLGEVEYTFSAFLSDYENGAPKDIYPPSDPRPDIADSPIPRFDLLNFKDYVMIGVQFSRGCPYNCEFCDIIEIYGRKPRTKSPEQITGELQRLYALGYRGHVDFVDDNFICHKGKVKEILRAVKKWSSEHDYPFYFSTEASINLADDDELLKLMQEIDFRYVFIGIEAVDDAVLKCSQKGQNRHRKLYDDMNKIYRHGMVVNGGFIIGFDEETSQAARLIADSINYCNICIPMIGLLYALPNTQLTIRLANENRLSDGINTLDAHNLDNVDQASSGLNFVTKRPRAEVISDYIYVLKNVFSRGKYFNRCLKMGMVLKTKRKHRPGFGKRLKTLVALFKLIRKMGIQPTTFYYFWRNIGVTLVIRPSSLEEVVNMMAMYLHFRKQTKYIINLMKQKLQTTPAIARTTDQ
jgi:radical SAM superfamily enzyme YgiQ (UPF0313 family)